MEAVSTKKYRVKTRKRKMLEALRAWVTSSGNSRTASRAVSYAMVLACNKDLVHRFIAVLHDNTIRLAALRALDSHIPHMSEGVAILMELSLNKRSVTADRL